MRNSVRGQRNLVDRSFPLLEIGTCLDEFNVVFLHTAHAGLVRAVSGVGSWPVCIFVVCCAGFKGRV